MKGDVGSQGGRKVRITRCTVGLVQTGDIGYCLYEKIVSNGRISVPSPFATSAWLIRYDSLKSGPRAGTFGRYCNI